MLALVLVVMVWYSISREDRYLELWVQLPGPSVGSSQQWAQGWSVRGWPT